MSYLAVWFGLHLLFGETGWMEWGALRLPTVVLASFDVKAALLSLLAFFLIMRLHWSLIRTIAVMSALGVIAQLAF